MLWRRTCVGIALSSAILALSGGAATTQEPPPPPPSAPPLSEAGAKAHADVAIATKYGALSAAGTRHWSRCIEYTELIGDDSDLGDLDEWWLCYFDFQTSAGSYRFGSVEVEVTGDAVASRIESVTAYGYRARRCSWRPYASESVRASRGRLTETATSCFSARKMADHVAYEAGRRLPRRVRRVITGMGGTGSADWPEWSEYTCTLRSRSVGGGARRYDARCENSLDWSFRAQVTVAKAQPRPRPRPRPRPTPAPDRCDPNYSGACLRPNASDYDCRGGSGDGPLYAGRVKVVGDDHYELDRDGDGVACEES